MKKNKIILLIVLGIVLVGLVVSIFMLFNSGNNNTLIAGSIDKTEEIKSHYNTYVTTNKEAKIYDKDDKEIGVIGDNVELSLEEIDINNDTKYFKIISNEWYINYQDVDVIEELSKEDTRYKNYIVYNKNIITGDVTTFYDKEGNLVYKINQSFDLPIIINDTDKYGVEYNNKLLYVSSEDVIETKDNSNTELTNSSGVGVLNYHAFYDETDEEERSSCVTEICHSKAQFKTHLDFFKENNILTLKMEELEMYVDGKIQLPKSVLITIDDGPKTEHAVDMLTEYEMYATIFLVTSWFNDIDSYYKTDFIELHSHTHDLHDGGECPGGQGGGLKCLDEEIILTDLNTSREALGGSTALCYPFYEYNDYTIRLAKEAGFTMGFIGESWNSDNLVHVGQDKYRLRRFVIVTYTTLNDLRNYFGQIK